MKNNKSIYPLNQIANTDTQYVIVQKNIELNILRIGTNHSIIKLAFGLIYIKNWYNQLSRVKSILLLTFTFSLFTLNSFSQGGGVAINETGNAAVNSAMLDVSSTTQGVLISRMTKAQRDLITLPASGLFIYNTDCKTFEYFDGSFWIPLQSSNSFITAPGVITGLSSVCSGQTNVAYSITPVPGATSYIWTVPSGSSIISGQNTTGITVTYSTSAGNICVTGNSVCGASSPACLQISLNSNLPVSVSIAENPTGTICSGTSVTFTASPTNGGTTPSYQWKLNNADVGTNVTYTNSTLVNNDKVKCVMTSNAICATGSPATSNEINISVNALPDTANAGADQNLIACATTTTLGGNTPDAGTGNWTVISGTAILTTPSSPTSGVTGLTVPSTVQLRWTISNSPCTASTDDVYITTGSFVDARDSKIYNAVQIGAQCWMAQNLNVGTYISSPTTGYLYSGMNNETPTPVIEKYCYGNVEANCNIYGGLYEWAEMVQYYNGATFTTSWSPVPTGNVQGICPSGWHLPADAEWCAMENAVEAGADVNCNIYGWRGTTLGNKLKTTGNGSPPLWASPSAGSNTNGFAALPAGNRWYFNGTFSYLGIQTYFWTATEYSATNAWDRTLLETSATTLRNYAHSKNYGLSVRCIQN
ncbi:MAG: hypothetical protein HGB12_01140 [Bacteroidetes bacterium]|nr:hypothetical protein [Bacteroidota bacterium]